MLPKGHCFYLEPDKYPKHAALVERLEFLPGWERVADEDPPEISVECDEEPEEQVEKILPHQAEVIKKIRQNLSPESYGA